MMNKILKQLITCDTKLFELSHSFIAAAWGFILILPSDSFSTTKTFSVMSQIAPEFFWGLVPLLIVIVHLIFIESKIVRKICIMALALFWLCVTFSVFFANSLSTATASYAGYFLLSIIRYLRVGGRDAK